MRKRYLIKQYDHLARTELKEAQQINKLQELLDSGAISQAEYDSRKKYIEERMQTVSDCLFFLLMTL